MTERKRIDQIGARARTASEASRVPSDYQNIFNAIMESYHKDELIRDNVHGAAAAAMAAGLRSRAPTHSLAGPRCIEELSKIAFQNTFYLEKIISGRRRPGIQDGVRVFRTHVSNRAGGAPPSLTRSRSAFGAWLARATCARDALETRSRRVNRVRDWGRNDWQE